MNSTLTRDWENLIKAFLLDCRARVKPRTANDYRLVLDHWLQWLRDTEAQQPVTLAQFRATDLNRYLVHRSEHGGRNGKGCSMVTRRMDCILLRMLIEFAYKNDYIERNPLADYKVPMAPVREQPLLSVEQATALLNAIEKRWDTQHNPKVRFTKPTARRFYKLRDRAIYAIALETGMRLGEIIALELSDIHDEDPHSPFLLVREPKNKRDRRVPYVCASPYLDEWRRIRPKCDNKRLFISIYGENMGIQRTSDTFRKYREVAGLPPEFHFHSARHYAATILANHNLVNASDILGHRDFKTTRRYVHSRDSEKALTMQEASPLKILVNKRSEANAERKKRRLV